MKTKSYRELQNELQAKQETGETLEGCVKVIAFIIFAALLALWTDRNLDFWCSYCKGVAVDVPYWLSLVVTAIFHSVALAANVIAEIARLLV